MDKSKSLFQHTWHKVFWNFIADQYEKDHGFGDFCIGSEFGSYELARWKIHIAELYQEQTGSSFPFEGDDHCFCCDYKRAESARCNDSREMESCKHCPLIWSDEEGNTLELCGSEGSEGSPYHVLRGLLGERILNPDIFGEDFWARDVFDSKIVELCRKIANLPVKKGVKTV